MKKTLIALFALAGVASAAVNTSTLITNIGAALDEQSYELGDSFTISMQIVSLGYSGNSANIIGLGSEFGSSNTGIRVQSSSGLTSAYLGVRIDNAESWKITSATWDAETKTNTLTLDTVEGVWITMGSNATEQANNLTDCVLTLSYDAVTNVSTFKVVDYDGVTNVVNYDNVKWNARNLTSGFNGTTWDNLSVEVTPAPAVPEPTTATLSLLALAGLAARRRR